MGRSKLLGGVALGATLLIITHDPELAQHCDRVVVMHDGRIEERVA